MSRPDWTPALDTLRRCAAGTVPTELRGSVDQVEAHIRDVYLAADIDLRDEWTLHTVITTLALTLSQLFSLATLGLVCPASAAATTSMLAGDIHMLCGYLPDDIRAQVAA